jgi:predicted DNA-binding transcriptional regulator AlpA
MSQPITATAPYVPVTTSEILTVEDLAKWLKVSKRSVYEMTRDRGQQRHEIPLPILRLPVGLRFRRIDIERWLDLCECAHCCTAREAAEVGTADAATAGAR